jgi:anti-sigma-K factor RskA
MSDIEIHHLGAAYALDALDPRERAAYEAHYSTCEICRTDVAEFRAAAAELGTLTSTAPPADVKQRVMAEIGTTRQLSPLPASVAKLSDHRRRRIVRTVLSVAAAAAFFVAGAIVIGGRGGDSFGDEMAAMMSDPSFAMVELTGDGDGSFQVAWTDDQVAVVGGELPDPGAGMRYELWLIDASGAHAMNMLDRADGGRVRRTFEIDEDPAAWGITIEPESGSTVPTEPVLFLGEATSAE